MSAIERSKGPKRLAASLVTTSACAVCVGATSTFSPDGNCCKWVCSPSHDRSPAATAVDHPGESRSRAQLAKSPPDGSHSASTTGWPSGTDAANRHSSW